jgi:hypothetical protein
MGCVWAGGQARLGARAPGSGNLASRSRLPADELPMATRAQEDLRLRWRRMGSGESRCSTGGASGPLCEVFSSRSPPLPGVGAEGLGSLRPLEEKTIVHPDSGSRKLLRAAGGGRRAGDRNTTGWGWRWRARSDYPARRSLRVRWLGGIWLGPPKPADAGARRALQAAGEEDGSGGPREGQRAHRVSDRIAAARA